ncbi:hypothetical protein [Sinorhizobium fredii]|uniref:hypothetical protein n=1 Tax=Rhizobium fredii TaxID=380 RepID=UPI0004B94E0A|nr:hypothetical protein [Sinorhizobium fredii]AWM23728.1 hypothetical protein AOX55_0000448 [Sinorhizobium fredii CCBAU 25509]
MNRRVAFPFLTLSDAAVDASPWSVALDGGEWLPAGDFLPDWDYASTIRLRRQLRIDREIASADLGISANELSLSLGLRLGTGQGRLPRLLVHQEDREIPAAREAALELEVSGDRLSAVLDIFTEIMLSTRPSTRDLLAPSRAGDRLWHDRQRIRLEGEEPRFPIEVADLGTLLADATAASAPWYLHWSPRDWRRDFHGAIRLYLNADRAEFIKKIEQQDPQTLQALMADVMGQVCERLVTDPSADEIIAQSDHGSLAAQAAAWLRQAWPGKDRDFVHSVLDNRPGVFRSAFLALAEPREE